MAATAAEEQAFIDGTHPALQGNAQAMSTLRSQSPPNRSHSPTSSASSSPRFTAVDPSPPPPALNPPTRTGGASNTGPKGVLADWAARNQGASHTGPKGVLSDYKGSQAAAAEHAMQNLRIVPLMALHGELSEEEDEDGRERDGDEDAARERYRRKRLMELSGSGERGPGKGRRTFGHLREIGFEQFLSAVEDEEPDVAVVLHIYEPEIEACAILNQHLSSIARSYPKTKFIRALASEVDFSADTEEDTLPTVLVYRGGELETTLVRVDQDWGKGTRQEVIKVLAGCDAISGSATVPLDTSRARGRDADSGDSD